MPVEPRLMGTKIRQTEAATGKIAINDKGTPVDGGGWDNEPDGWAKANRQAGHMNPAKRT